MLPTIFVFDLDHTLIYFDEEGDIFITPSYYVRKYSHELLTFLKSLNENNLLVLWTRGTKEYAYDVLTNTNLGMNFNYVLCEEECQESIKYFQYPKSKEYLYEFITNTEKPLGIDKDTLDTYNCILIDDKAVENGASTYDEYIQIKPYTKTIAKKENDKKIILDFELYHLAAIFVDDFLNLNLK